MREDQNFYIPFYWDMVYNQQTHPRLVARHHHHEPNQGLEITSTLMK
jgi:hypothetical protein